MRIILFTCALIVIAGGLLFAIDTRERPTGSAPSEPMSIVEQEPETVASAEPVAAEPVSKGEVPEEQVPEAEVPEAPEQPEEAPESESPPRTRPESRRDLVERIDERSIRLDDRLDRKSVV